MNLDRRQVLDLIYYEPYKIGHWVGFRDLTELHNNWIRSFLFVVDDQTLQGHRGSYKTTCVEIFIALAIVLWPNITIIFFRKTLGDVIEVIETVSKILKSSCMGVLVRALYGKDLVLTKDTATEISTNLKTDIRGTSQVIGLGIGTSITGKHADIVMTDDIVNVVDRVSRAERERTKIAYQELQNVKNRGGRFINTGTPWHAEDAFTLMPAPQKYDCYSTGLMSQEEIEEIRGKMLPSLFAANYELRHIASEDVIFTNPVAGGDPAKVEQARYCHVDAAYGGSDFTAFTIVRKAEGKCYVYGRMWPRHVDDVLEEIVSLRKRFMAGKIQTEDNADKGYLAKELRKRGERVITYHEDMNKFLKITSYLKGEWSNVVFVDGTDEEYIKQITDYNENAEHDDAPDSLASLLRILWGKSDDAPRGTYLNEI